MLFINFKTYPEATGEKAVGLTEAIAKAARSFPQVKVAIAPAAVDLFRVTTARGRSSSGLGGGLELWSQHLDSALPGRSTGFVTAEAVKAAGAVGTFLNHSEHPLAIPAIPARPGLAEAAAAAKRANLKVLIFAGGIDEVQKVKGLNPDYIAVEVEELIGSRATSISQARPELIRRAVKIAGPDKLLVGAGIHCRRDVAAALALGACGVVVSSDIVKSDDPARELEDLLWGFKSG